MILQALTSFYEKLVEEGELGTAGWCNANVSYAININLQGELQGLHSLLVSEERGKKTVMVPITQTIPSHPSRSAGLLPYFLCDNAKYLLGAWQESEDAEENQKNKDKAAEYFKAAAEYHTRILEKDDSPLAKSICLFFEKWDFNKDKEKLNIAIEDILMATNLVFRLVETGDYILSDEEMRKVWDETYANSSSEETGICLITGKRAPVARLHPLIKGVRGAQSSGAALVSFNGQAFESYGKKQGANAPVSEYAANAYGQALNYLLSHSKYNRVIGDTTVVYWAETGEVEYADWLSAMALEENNDDFDKLFTVMARVAEGKPCEYQDIVMRPETKFYILGISPNAARLSVRFFYENTFETLVKNVMAHYQRMELIKPAYIQQKYVSIERILYETANKNAKDKQAQPILVGAFFQAVIHNTRYPTALFHAIMIRIRADKDVNWYRVSMIKAYLIKNVEKYKEVIDTMQLNEETTYTPHVLGRIFAVLEFIQKSANQDLNTTIKDKYLNAACATPAIVYPQLLKLSSSHLKVLERKNAKLKGRLENLLILLMSRLDSSFPKHLSLDDQGDFMIGYFQQQPKLYAMMKED